MEMSDNLKAALRDVSQYVAQDMTDSEASNPLIVAEVTIDAGRLKMNGNDAADDEVSRLINKHGYSAVLDEAAKHVSTA